LPILNDAPLYQQIAESIRQEIARGQLKPGDGLPSVRRLTSRWHCTPGTIQRAYQELVGQGLVVSRPGQGTRVVGGFMSEEDKPLRRATLVHRANSFLLESVTAGYSPVEVEQAFHLALDQWKVIGESQGSTDEKDVIVFMGSHDLSVSWIATHCSEIVPGHSIRVSFNGSLGGLIALAQGKADIAGSHLWDEESDLYNVPFVRRLLPGQKVALATLVERRMGVICPPNNPRQIKQLEDISQGGLRFVNRQRGSGTRVWLDVSLARKKIDPQTINGYEREVNTHSEAAQWVAEGRADAGLGLEASALAYGLSFIPLTVERYDLVIPRNKFDRADIQLLLEWLQSPAAKKAFAGIGGYLTEKTGEIFWVNG
jgi:molybdate-binding protein/DNA-binding transcriptional regulator YhcF (GntR family)